MGINEVRGRKKILGKP